jgi:hypothetical protein
MSSDAPISKTLAVDLFADVRKGFIIGRLVLESENGQPLRYPYDATPDTAYSFPEFVEATARAGFYKWSKQLPIAQCFTAGVAAAVKTLNKDVTKNNKKL